MDLIKFFYENSGLISDYLSEKDYSKLFLYLFKMRDFIYVPQEIDVYRISSNVYSERLNELPIKNISKCCILIQTLSGDKFYKNTAGEQYDKLIFVKYLSSYFWVTMKEITEKEYCHT